MFTFCVSALVKVTAHREQRGDCSLSTEVSQTSTVNIAVIVLCFLTGILSIHRVNGQCVLNSVGAHVCLEAQGHHVL